MIRSTAPIDAQDSYVVAALDAARPFMPVVAAA
jgi:hypothetical protein